MRKSLRRLADGPEPARDHEVVLLPGQVVEGRQVIGNGRARGDRLPLDVQLSHGPQQTAVGAVFDRILGAADKRLLEDKPDPDLPAATR